MTLLCLNCGEPVEENPDGVWVNPDGKPCRPGRSHWAGQVIPDTDTLAVVRARMAPRIDDYTTWYDPEADVYRASRNGGLPDAAILAGGFVRLYARSAVTLKQACAHNDFVVSRWGVWTGDLT